MPAATVTSTAGALSAHARRRSNFVDTDSRTRFQARGENSRSDVQGTVHTSEGMRERSATVRSGGGRFALAEPKDKFPVSGGELLIAVNAHEGQLSFNHSPGGTTEDSQ
jgi:hypothetical protein